MTRHLYQITNKRFATVKTCTNPPCYGRRGHDRMVVEITTTYVIGAYHH